MNVLDKLAVPFSPKQIHWRIGNKSKKKDKAAALAYIDARDVMNRLDRVLGAANWKDDYHAEQPRKVRKFDRSSKEYYYEEICGRVKCLLSIRVDGEWITKADAAGETNVEGEKGGYSDAFKRAAVKFGIGRDLYSLDARYYPIDQFNSFTQVPALPDWYMQKIKEAAAKLNQTKTNEEK